jgi:hypothetical protein
MVAQRGRDPYLRLIGERYLALEGIAQAKEEEGQGVHEVVIFYHSPAERIAVVSDIYRDDRSEALIVEGVDRDGVFREAIVYPESAHFVLKVLPVLPDESPRPTPGFIRE